PVRFAVNRHSWKRRVAESPNAELPPKRNRLLWPTTRRTSESLCTRTPLLQAIVLWSGFKWTARRSIVDIELQMCGSSVSVNGRSPPPTRQLYPEAPDVFSVIRSPENNLAIINCAPEPC